MQNQNKDPSDRLVSYTTRAAAIEKRKRSRLSELENIGPNVALQVKVSVDDLASSIVSVDVQSLQITLLPEEKTEKKRPTKESASAGNRKCLSFHSIFH